MKRVLAVLAVISVIAWGPFAPALADDGTGTGHFQGMRGGMGGMMGGQMGPGMMGAGGMMGPGGRAEGAPAVERPLISQALRNKDQLGLTQDQVKTLEVLQSEFQKEATRRSADIQVAEMELAELLRADPVDLGKVEAKLRQVEGLRTDLRFGRIKTLEKGKAVLTAEQRNKLESLDPRAAADAPESVMAGRGMEEMQRFMNSERMPQAMAAMMEMARQMGNGDPMAGMVRMMEMMSMMGQMGGQGGMGGMMGPGRSQPTR